MNRRNNWGRRGRGGRGGWRGRSGHNNPGRSSYKNQSPPDQLTESEVGVTEYISDLRGFSGVIKARFSDFHVNEVNRSGEVAKLTETKIPQEFQLTKAPEVPGECPIDELTQEKWDEILAMLAAKDDSKVRLELAGYDKEKRTALHKRIKDVFRERVVCSTVTADEETFIEIKRYTKECKTIKEWPKGLEEYVHFLLYKESLDTMDSIFKIADLLKIPPSAFNYAGVKDRRAKTTQWISVFKVEPYKLLIKTKCFRNIKIGNLSFKSAPLKLGQLQGNVFRIALRNITEDDEIINKSLESLRDKGFINYYGLQRFGSDKEVPTFDVGIKLMQGKWKEACQLILKPKKSEDPSSDVVIAKKLYLETGDAKKAKEKLWKSSGSTIESKLLCGLAENEKNDFVNALEKVPRNIRLLYIHSLQSLIWNKVVSKRIKEYGLSPIVGDIVLLTQDEEETVEVDDDKKCDEAEKTETTQKVKVLTESDLENYTIYDVVLPLPGYDIVYPNNNIKDYYKEILESYELQLEMTKQSVKTYTLSGSYRKILGKAEEFTWKFLKYNDPNDTLIRSDFEEIIGHKEPESVDDGKYKALVLKFRLRSSNYATMVLREALKIDTSCQVQSKLNNYHETSEPKPEVIAESSLLNKKDEFEAFKRAIFESPGDPVKHKIEGEAGPTEAKKQRLDEDDSGIKVEASLV